MASTPVCLLAALLCGSAVFAEDRSTDANLVTGIDVSASVSPAAIHSELAGIAAAMRSPELLSAIRRGREGRIGFAIFTWHEAQSVIVPWTTIATERDAEAVARLLEDPRALELALTPFHPRPGRAGWGTDLSKAIDYAGELLDTAPTMADRHVVNMIGNGMDNVGEAAAAGRNRLLASGATLNGVVFGGDVVTFIYFRTQVVGGEGAFLMAADPETGIVEAMRRKFLQDLVAGSPAGDSGPS